MENDKVTCWTIQAQPQWEHLLRNGTLFADGRRAPVYFRDAYRWMRRQAVIRISGFRDRPLFWVWCKPKPDLRMRGHLPLGMRGVRIEFVVPRHRILCSDFDAWHCVLNHQYLALSQEEDDIWYARPWVERTNQDLEKSWERIFDLERIHTSSWIGPVTHIQGVMENLSLHEVTRVHHFISR